jgi:proton-translocating NADH-quinone oxidoreductase chain M
LFPLLPIIVLIPLLSTLPLFAFHRRHSFKIALASSVIVLILVAYASYVGLSEGFGILSFSQGYLPSLGISLSLEVTQYSVILLVMSAIVLLSAAIVAKGFIKESGRIYNLLFLLAGSSAIGLFLSGSLFLFYAFWELGEVAMFFTIYLFGGFDRRYAAIKFIVYSVAASLSLLVGIMLIYSGVPAHTFDIGSIVSQAAAIPLQTQLAAMLLLAFAFMMKLPVFPFHSWLPDAYSEAPAPGSMVLAGVMPKFGAYGLLLMLLMLPAAGAYTNYFAVLFGFSALYCAIVAIRQSNLKRLLAYASATGMGIASLGIVSLTEAGTAGALYSLLSHGIVISLMFLLSGALDESFGTFAMERIKGVLKTFPALAYSFVFGAFAIVGLPLTAGFVGDLLVFSGAFKAFGAVGIVPIGAIALLGACLFFVLEKSFLNVSDAVEPYQGPRRSVYVAIALLVAATLLFGILPSLLLSPFAV